MNNLKTFTPPYLVTVAAVLTAVWGACSVHGQQVHAKPAAPAQDANATYLRDALPIFMGKCIRCHNPQMSLLPNWMDYKTAYKHRTEIKRRVWDSWKGNYYKQTMPAGTGPECQTMTEAEREQIKEWVESGAVLGTQPKPEQIQSRPELMAQGQRLFNMVCAQCHQPNAQGIPDKFPPLARSDFLNADKNRAIKTLLHGRQGAIIVNGKIYNNSMPMFPLSNEDIAAALSYVYASFGNSGKTVTPADVEAMRGQKDDDLPAMPSEVAHSPAPKSEFE